MACRLLRQRLLSPCAGGPVPCRSTHSPPLPPPPYPPLPAVDPVDVGTSGSSNLQDILRLLTLWFSYGAAPDVEAALQEGFGHVSIDTWLVVIPQVWGAGQGRARLQHSVAAPADGPPLC